MDGMWTVRLGPEAVDSYVEADRSVALLSYIIFVEPVTIGRTSDKTLEASEILGTKGRRIPR